MEKSVTISCRVTPDVKMQLAQRSEKLGMKLCNYIELLVLNQFENEQKGDLKTVTENTVENDIQNNLIEPNFQTLITYQTDDIQAEIFEKHINILQEKHEDSTEIELLNACLIHAITNDKALWQRNLSVFLNRLKKGEYDN